MLKNKIGSLFVLIAAMFVVGFGHNLCFAQDEEKSIQSEDLIAKRPVKAMAKINGSNTNTKKTPPKNTVKRKKVFYKVVKTSRKKSANTGVKKSEDALIGFTVWKMRLAGKTDPAKEFVEENSGGVKQNVEYTLERMPTESPIQLGERIRLSVESLSHSGYLYVVERELYEDGTYSDPKLIYPTARSRYKNVPIGAGNLIFVPEGNRNFRIVSTQDEKKQTAEVLTVIVSPKMLVDQAILQNKSISLSPEEFAKWLDQWEVDTTLLEQIDGAGQTLTLVEQNAGNDAAKGLTEEPSRLTRDDAVPQSIFRGKVKSGNPYLFNVVLNFDEK